MKQWQQPEAMIFDLDGTLFKTETLLLPAYYATFDQMRQEGIYAGATPPDERILGSLGMLLEYIWERVIPGSSNTVRRRADELLLQYQLDGLKQGLGELYPGVEAALQELHFRGVKLFVASNGLEQYVKEVVRHKGLSPLFVDLYSAGQYQTRSKVDLVRGLLDRYGIRSAWMVGDRSSDVEAGRENNLMVVGCDYAGFRKADELDNADRIITDFSQLLDLNR